MTGKIEAYRKYVLREHTHTWGAWLLDGVGEIEVCECGGTRIPPPREPREN